MRRFRTTLAHDHAQTWNGAESSKALGVSAPTVRGHLDALTDSLMVRQLLRGTHQGAEIDLLSETDGTQVGFEIKRTVQPR